MGKGDIKTKKGKMNNSSFGRSRNRKALKAKKQKFRRKPEGVY